MPEREEMLKMTTCREKYFIAFALMFFFCAQWALAKVDLVTIPGRDSVQITIYNTEDLTLVKEQRHVTLRRGLNEIQFSWAGTLIDPTSLNLVFKQTPEKFRILDITYPAFVQNVLIWDIESEEAGLVPIEITYFTSGLDWKGDYVVKANPQETAMDVEGYVTVVNRSGEDYDNTEVRLLVGEVHLVEKIVDLAAGRKPEAKIKEMYLGAAVERAAEAMAMAPKRIVKEGISEYFLYTIEGRDTIPDQWSKRLPSFSSKNVPVTLTYVFDDHKYGNQVTKLYKFKNNKESNLGKEPLPDGLYNVFRDDGKGGLSYINNTRYKYIPIGEEVEMVLGADGLITLEAKKMNFQRKEVVFDVGGNVNGFDTVDDWRIEIRNSKSADVPLEVTRHFDGDWDIQSKDTFERVDKNTIKYKVTVPALGKRVIDYAITTRHGARSRQVQQ
jgi:hypothetical protein